MTDLQIELQHLVKCSKPHPNCSLYCQQKAEWLAQKYPDRFRELPMLLSRELSGKGTSTTGTETT
ncbi:hypothetical protein VLK31_34845 [Variovorax sp. H27-G14]|uniref:hypothetical protein n=1 Tax=Variovorax sp. H27-G14 TaxID=3111914 RepID=UPI0038FBF0CD